MEVWGRAETRGRARSSKTREAMETWAGRKGREAFWAWFVWEPGRREPSEWHLALPTGASGRPKHNANRALSGPGLGSGEIRARALLPVFTVLSGRAAWAFENVPPGTSAI